MGHWPENTPTHTSFTFWQITLTNFEDMTKMLHEHHTQRRCSDAWPVCAENTYNQRPARQLTIVFDSRRVSVRNHGRKPISQQFFRSHKNWSHLGCIDRVNAPQETLYNSLAQTARSLTFGRFAPINWYRSMGYIYYRVPLPKEIIKLKNRNARWDMAGVVPSRGNHPPIKRHFTLSLIAREILLFRISPLARTTIMTLPSVFETREQKKHVYFTRGQNPRIPLFLRPFRGKKGPIWGAALVGQQHQKRFFSFRTV